MSNHDDAAFVRNFSLVLVGLCVVGLTAFVLAKIVNNAYQETASYAPTAAERTAPVGALNVGTEAVTVATPQSTAAATPTPAGATAAASAASSADLGKATYDQICFACHAQGIAGAPKLGDAVAWEPRVAQGRDMLVSHAINGFTGSAGMMPAKGGNPALGDDAIGASVDYMIAATKGGAAPAAETAAPAATEAAPAAVAEAAPAAADGKGKETYDAACFVCHASGVAGAPKFGDTAAWAPRIEKGVDTLYHSALNGFMGSAGMMPPKGGRPDIADDDIKAAVDYLISSSKQ